MKRFLQVLLLAILFGLALGRLGDHGRPVLNLLHEVSRVFFGIVAIVTRAAPLAAAGAMAFTIGEYGVGKLAQLGSLLACVYLTCVLFIVLILGGIARLGGFSLFKIIRYVREELLLVLGTSSSESALPGLMEKMEKSCFESSRISARPKHRWRSFGTWERSCSTSLAVNIFSNLSTLARSKVRVKSLVPSENVATIHSLPARRELIGDLLA